MHPFIHSLSSPGDSPAICCASAPTSPSGGCLPALGGMLAVSASIRTQRSDLPSVSPSSPQRLPAVSPSSPNPLPLSLPLYSPILSLSSPDRDTLASFGPPSGLADDRPPSRLSLLRGRQHRPAADTRGPFVRQQKRPRPVL